VPFSATERFISSTTNTSDHDNGQHPEHIEVGERRCLLPARLPAPASQLLRRDRIAGLRRNGPAA
jgi:hypothetical protein